MTNGKHQYKQIVYPSNSDVEHEEPCNDFVVQRQLALQKYTIAALGISVLLFILSIGFFIAGLSEQSSELQCAKLLSTYSPVIDAIKYKELNFDNEFEHQTKYRGQPSNRLEAEWEKLWRHDLVAIPDKDLIHLNKSSSQPFLRVSPTQGDGFAANIEVFHQLHCLNLIRQYTWFSHYSAHPELVETPADFTLDTEEGLRIHVDHCIETLRLNIMCLGDTTPYLHIHETPGDEGTADFDSHHKCRDFEAIVTAWEAKTVMPRFKHFGKQYVKYLEN